MTIAGSHGAVVRHRRAWRPARSHEPGYVVSHVRPVQAVGQQRTHGAGGPADGSGREAAAYGGRRAAKRRLIQQWV